MAVDVGDASTISITGGSKWDFPSGGDFCRVLRQGGARKNPAPVRELCASPNQSSDLNIEAEHAVGLCSPGSPTQSQAAPHPSPNFSHPASQPHTRGTSTYHVACNFANYISNSNSNKTPSRWQFFMSPTCPESGYHLVNLHMCMGLPSL